MGYTRNHTIIVSATVSERLSVAHNVARNLFGSLCSDILPHAANGGGAFFVSPDGSKEGWTESDVGDAKRAELCCVLRANHPWLDWAEIILGGDDDEYEIVQSAKDHG